ncbi:hypothetical protein [Natranaerobius trueperi]|nr:hypothetical protein [Natranaerobius trueperi]
MTKVTCNANCKFQRDGRCTLEQIDVRREYEVEALCLDFVPNYEEGPLT